MRNGLSSCESKWMLPIWTLSKPRLLLRCGLPDFWPGCGLPKGVFPHGCRCAISKRMWRSSVQGAELGPLHSHLIWRATKVQFTSIQLKLANGFVDGLGAVDLATDTPRYQFSLNAQDLPWKGGFLSAEGEVTTSGFGAAVLANLRASGSFSAENVRLSADDFFETMEGKFALSLADSRPDLRLSNIAAANGADVWTGEAAVEEDGKLVLNLVRDSDQRRIVSALDFPDSYNR